MVDLWFGSVYLHRDPRKSVLKPKCLELKYHILSQVLICLCLLCPSISRKTCCCAITGKSVNQHIADLASRGFAAFCKLHSKIEHCIIYICICICATPTSLTGRLLMCSEGWSHKIRRHLTQALGISTKENLTNLTTSRESSNSQKVVVIMLV